MPCSIGDCMYKLTDQLVKCPTCGYHHYWMEEDAPKLETLNIPDGVPETEDKRNANRETTTGKERTDTELTA